MVLRKCGLFKVNGSIPVVAVLADCLKMGPVRGVMLFLHGAAWVVCWVV